MLATDPISSNILQVSMDGDKKVVVLFKLTAQKFSIVKQITPADGAMGGVSGLREAEAGEKVVFEVKPAGGCAVTAIKVQTKGTPAVDIPYSRESVENRYSFTMPAEAVAIAVEFGAHRVQNEYKIELKYTPIDGNLGKLETTKASAAAGETIGLTVVVGADAQLKRGSLQAYTDDAGRAKVELTAQASKFNSYAFMMPAAGVVIEAVFEPLLKSAVESEQLVRLDASPNPCGEWLNVIGCESARRIELFTVTGDPVLAVTLWGERAVRILMRLLPSGVYLLRTTAADGQRIVRVLHE